MTWRIVDVSSNSKLDLKLNHMVVRDGTTMRKVFIPDIAVLVIESTAVSMTAALLCELTRNGIKIIFCDEKRNPYGELCPYYGTADSVEKIRKQISWDSSLTDQIWKSIVIRKILNQAAVLEHNGHEEKANQLRAYAKDVCPADSTNREGHAAKVYFNTLFDDGFSRRDDCAVNGALNYGYAVLLSAVNREIAAFGYSTMLGVFHDNGSNPFNLGSDLMEPFRPVIDEQVLSMNFVEFGPDQKHKLLDVLNKQVIIDGKHQFLLNAIRVYVQSFFTAIECKNVTKIKFHEMVFNEGETHESDRLLRSAD